MPNFYLNSNAQWNGDHEVHQDPCAYMPAPQNQIPLGFHMHCAGAVVTAQFKFPQAKINGCAFCCPDCHTT